MIASRLKNFLEQEGTQYLTIQHSVAYYASEIARVAHIHSKEFAKTLIVKADDRRVMVVLAASQKWSGKSNVLDSRSDCKERSR